MSQPHIINALDIGSGTIKFLSVAKKPKENDFEILSQSQEVSFGVRKGMITDTRKVAEIISSLAQKASQDTGRRIDNVYATIGGHHISSAFSRGLVSVSRADQKISKEDIERVLQAAKTIHLPANNEIIGVFPKEFIVDGARGIKDATGMQGIRLEADVLMLCGFSPFLKNCYKTITSSGLQASNLIPDILASAKAVLTPREKELGVCILDIGAGTTGMAVYEEGVLAHTVVFAIGSAHITNDIAVCLKTDIDTAEKVKIEYGEYKKASNEKKNEKKVKIECEDDLEFSTKMLSDIIECRLSDIFDEVGKELKKISRFGALPAGIVLTGGGAKIPGIKELAKKELKLPCRIGAPSVFRTLEDPSFSTLCGLAMEGFDLEAGEDEGFSNPAHGIFSRIKNALKVFIP